MKKIIVLFMMLILSVTIVGCNGKSNNGKFYNLEEAYANEWLTESDLQKIASLYNNQIQSELSDQKLEKKLKSVYLKELKNKVSEAKIEDIHIKNYYGTYGKCCVVDIFDDCICYDLYFVKEKEIGNVIFQNYCSRCILVFYSQN